MLQIFLKSITLLVFLVVIVCGIYPVTIWIIGQTVFSFQANGSILTGSDGKPVGSKLIAQPFTKDEYFQPRPSAASYDAAASASSALAASNYALRDRVARTIGPIAQYQNGQAVAPDIEKWFQQDSFQGKPNIVAQWATMHNLLAKAWVAADPAHAAYVDNWMKTHPAVVAEFVKDNPTILQPQATDMAVVFFQNFSQENKGNFPSSITQTALNGKTEVSVKPVNTGSDIQSIFFDMWRQDNPDVALQNIPGDFVTTSASGLDPDITLQNAEFQLNRVANKWAVDLGRNPVDVKNEIEQMLQQNTHAPLGGLAGEKFVNVLEVNLELTKRYGAVSSK
ncbi:MAG: potassium-transporting ATPase subunit C [Legionellales bacterium]|nr:potassium-transporting ATPase subunit C [Legionellales bacterium]